MTKRLMYGLVVAYLCTITVGIVSIQYANYVDMQSNVKWCSLLVQLDDAYQQTPSRTELGRHLASEFHRLRIEFECE